MKKALKYAAAVCLCSWTVFCIADCACGWDIKSHKILFGAFECLYMLLPMAVAVALQLIHREPLRSTGFLKLNLGWTYLAALLLPLVAVGLCILISALFPGVKLHYGADQVIARSGLDDTTADALRAQLGAVPPALFIGSQIVSGIIAGCTVNALFAFGEEYGWRNYMVSALEGVGFCRKSVVIGMVWGIWHMPLILLGHNYPQHPGLGIAMMCALCVLMGTIELYLVLKSGSVFPAAIFHGTINALAGLVPLLVEGGNDLTVGLPGASGFISLILIIAGIAVYDKIRGSRIAY